MDISIFLTAIKCVIGASIFFVWVIRYDNIKKEFKQYAYPDWLRDLVGILKFIFFLFLLPEHTALNMIGCCGIAGLMSAAVITHIKVKHALYKIVPSFLLMSLSLLALLLFLL